jgi:general secretion pathway protein I
MSGTRRAPAQRGFTLIEVVVAFALLALVFSVAFEIFSSGLSRAATLEDRSRALEVARSRLASAGLEQTLAPGISQGDGEDPRFHWTLAVTPFEVSSDALHPIQSAYALFRVAVEVDWRDADGKDRTMSLSTLQLGPRAQ